MPCVSRTNFMWNVSLIREVTSQSVLPKIGPYCKDAKGHEEVMGCANDVLEHHEQEGVGVEGRHQLHDHHGERVGEHHHHHQHHQQG